MVCIRCKLTPATKLCNIHARFALDQGEEMLKNWVTCQPWQLTHAFKNVKMKVTTDSATQNFLTQIILKDLYRNTSVISGKIIMDILQGLGVGAGYTTEHWPYRKDARKSAFFRKNNKNYLKYFFYLYIYGTN